MQRHTLLAILALAPSCVSVTHTGTSIETDPTVIRREERDGATTTWRLHTDRGGEPQLERTEKRPRDVAHVGVRVRALTRERASELGLDAFGGVVVESVTDDSSADRAGVRAGDVLLELDGHALTSPEQFTDLVANELAPGASVPLAARRRASGAAESLEFVLELGTRRSEDTATETRALRGSRLVRDLTGLEAAEVSASVAEEAFGTAAPFVIVAGVKAGSPAYLAGLRAGDRVTALDGEPLASLDTLVAAVIARADQRGVAVASGDRASLAVSRAAQGPLELRVSGPLGDHSGKVDVRDDLDERSEVDIPILFECESDVASTEWSLLDFIFQFGANSRSRYVASNTREPAKYSFFSMLPFGFYEVEKSPGRARYCIFWFIEWERRR